MPRAAPQLNIRSAYARARSAELARRTGMTATEVIEEALRAYTPSPPAEDDLPPPPPGMIRKGGLLVLKSRGGRKITLEDTNAAIEADRNERADAVWNCS